MSTAAVNTPVSYYKQSASTQTLAEPFPQDVMEVFNSLEGLGTNDDLFLPGEQRPSKENIDWAKNVLLRVLPRKCLSGARIEPFQTEIHVSWEGTTKRVVAFLPAPDLLKVYHESIQNQVAVQPVLNPAATPADLCQTLKWFFQD